MLSKRVKLKLNQPGPMWLILLALASSLASFGGLFPASLVERWYATGMYPLLSVVMSGMSDGVGFSWLDVSILLALPVVGYLVYRRKLLTLIGVAAVGYLFFFWTWGLNYHRLPLVSKLDFDSELVTKESIRTFTGLVAAQLNRLYADRAAATYDPDELSAKAAVRISHVVQELDGISWKASKRVKSSWILDPFFKAAGVEGMFNPFGHEFLVTSDVLSFEQPMILAHEMAHVRGYSEEGDANFIALMACINTKDPVFRYSGWFTLWLYLPSAEPEVLLEEGPRKDLAALFERRLANRIVWINDLQAQIFDFFLKANHVEDGVRSYARIVTMAVGTEPSWARFAETEEPSP